ncbi:MAG: Rmt family 16S rRNA (guanine(1405)-N(7))-methyltransferase [Cytophagales bacterium]|nr:Rmt family 16S rRNA (guanine(1405)-N(7))-methyltransferase [Cytophagales bacterium]
MSGDPSKAVQQILKAKKYANLSPDTVQRILDWAEARVKKKEVDKTARKKLHQIYGAYFNPSNATAFEKALRDRPDNQDEIKEFCQELMDLHSSSQERLEDLSGFYNRIFEVTGIPDRMIDLACGLNPLSYPWIHEHGAIPYVGYDIDQKTTQLMNELLQSFGYPAQVYFNDLFLNIPEHREIDVVMLLKALPCLEQQEKGISVKLLTEIKCRFLVVSFPSKSLGGKSKGMETNYEAFLNTVVDESRHSIHKINFEREIVYVLERAD